VLPRIVNSARERSIGSTMLRKPEVATHLRAFGFRIRDLPTTRDRIIAASAR
jgi:hypothetical protein